MIPADLILFIISSWVNSLVRLLHILGSLSFPLHQEQQQDQEQRQIPQESIHFIKKAYNEPVIIL